MRKTLHGYSKELSCVSWSGIKAFIHSFEHASQAFVFKREVSSYSGHTVHAVNYLKSSLARLELVIYHTVSEYYVMNL